MNHTFTVEKQVGKLIARAWLDTDFFQCLLDSPGRVLEESGIAATDFVAFANKQNLEGGTSLPAKPIDLLDDVLLVSVENLLASVCRGSTT